MHAAAGNEVRADQGAARKLPLAQYGSPRAHGARIPHAKRAVKARREKAAHVGGKLKPRHRSLLRARLLGKGHLVRVARGLHLARGGHARDGDGETPIKQPDKASGAAL